MFDRIDAEKIKQTTILISVIEEKLKLYSAVYVYYNNQFKFMVKAK